MTRVLHITVWESRNGGWQANVAETGSSWTVRSDQDPVEAVRQALEGHAANDGPAPLLYEQMRDLRRAMEGALAAPGEQPPAVEPAPAEPIDIMDLLG